jgi:hypothetical protein
MTIQTDAQALQAQLRAMPRRQRKELLRKLIERTQRLSELVATAESVANSIGADEAPSNAPTATSPA